MTWEDWHTARQVLAEERLGAPVRTMQRAEDEQAEAIKIAIERVERQQNNTPAVIPPRPITDEILGAR